MSYNFWFAVNGEEPQWFNHGEEMFGRALIEASKLDEGQSFFLHYGDRVIGHMFGLKPHLEFA